MNGILGSGRKTAVVGPAGQATADGWLAAYHGDNSAAALVQGGATGAGTAGRNAIAQNRFEADH